MDSWIPRFQHQQLYSTTEVNICRQKSLAERLRRSKKRLPERLRKLLSRTRNIIVETDIVEEVFQDGELVEVVVIEEFAKRGEKPPRAKTYVVRIDKKTYHIHKPDPTGEELLAAAGKTSAGYKLYQVFRGKQPEPVAPGQHVDLRAHGVERFTTVPKDPVRAVLRRRLAGTSLWERPMLTRSMR